MNRFSILFPVISGLKHPPSDQFPLLASQFLYLLVGPLDQGHFLLRFPQLHRLIGPPPGCLSKPISTSCHDCLVSGPFALGQNLTPDNVSLTHAVFTIEASIPIIPRRSFGQSFSPLPCYQGPLPDPNSTQQRLGKINMYTRPIIVSPGSFDRETVHPKLRAYLISCSSND